MNNNRKLTYPIIHLMTIKFVYIFRKRRTFIIFIRRNINKVLEIENINHKISLLEKASLLI
jgi:hypothetical protein